MDALPKWITNKLGQRKQTRTVFDKRQKVSQNYKDCVISQQIVRNYLKKRGSFQGLSCGDVSSPSPTPGLNIKKLANRFRMRSLSPDMCHFDRDYLTQDTDKFQRQYNFEKLPQLRKKQPFHVKKLEINLLSQTTHMYNSNDTQTEEKQFDQVQYQAPEAGVVKTYNCKFLIMGEQLYYKQYSFNYKITGQQYRELKSAMFKQDRRFRQLLDNKRFKKLINCIMGRLGKLFKV